MEEIFLYNEENNTWMLGNLNFTSPAAKDISTVTRMRIYPGQHSILYFRTPFIIYSLYIMAIDPVLRTVHLKFLLFWKLRYVRTFLLSKHNNNATRHWEIPPNGSLLFWKIVWLQEVRNENNMNESVSKKIPELLYGPFLGQLMTVDGEKWDIEDHNNISTCLGLKISTSAKQLVAMNWSLSKLIYFHSECKIFPKSSFSFQWTVLEIKSKILYEANFQNTVIFLRSFLTYTYASLISRQWYSDIWQVPVSVSIDHQLPNVRYA
jgi:hypothetical protein